MCCTVKSRRGTAPWPRPPGFIITYLPINYLLFNGSFFYINFKILPFASAASAARRRLSSTITLS